MSGNRGNKRAAAISYDPLYETIAGTLSAGVVLAQALYFAKTKEEGVFWKSLAGWCLAVNMKPDTVKNSLKALKKRGLLILLPKEKSATEDNRYKVDKERVLFIKKELLLWSEKTKKPLYSSEAEQEAERLLGVTRTEGKIHQEEGKISPSLSEKIPQTEGKIHQVNTKNIPENTAKNTPLSSLRSESGASGDAADGKEAELDSLEKSKVKSETEQARLVKLTYGKWVTTAPPPKKEYVAAAELLKKYTLETIIEVYDEWAKRNRPDFGYSLTKFGSVVDGMVSARLRQKERADTATSEFDKQCAFIKRIQQERSLPTFEMAAAIVYREGLSWKDEEAQPSSSALDQRFARIAAVQQERGVTWEVAAAIVSRGE
jgi:hypothetical protein